MPPSDPAATALRHLDGALAKRPEKDGHALSAALRCLGEYRDGVVAAHRAASDGRHRGILERVNALISSVMAFQYPIGEEQWAELEKARDWLAGARGARTASMRTFLLPAILGDEPQLAALRQSLEGRIDFDLVDLPDLDASAAVLSSMDKTARVVVDGIVERQPTGPIALIGFSFGASLALEVAAHLIRRQRTISFLGVLDGAFRTDELKRPKTELLRLSFTMKGIGSVVSRLLEKLNNRRRLFIAAQFNPTKLTQSPAVRDALLVDLRCKALNNWQPPACSAPGLLIFSGTLGDQNRSRWVSLCPHLSVLTAEAEHGSFLKGPSLMMIVQALAERAGSGG